MAPAASPLIRPEADLSRSERIRRWVADLPPYTFFQLQDVEAGVPGASRNLAANVLSNLTADEATVERVAHGCYIRTGDLPFWDFELAAMEYAGPGSGYAKRTALRELGWVWQAPCKAQIAVVGRAPRIAIRGCRFVSRANRARLALNWAEITLLEAIRSGAFLEFTWEQVMVRFHKGTALTAFGTPVTVDPDALEYAGLREPALRPVVYERIQEAAEAIRNG